MSYIIGNKCVSVCDTACVKVCPVDCINGPINVEGLGVEVEKMTKEELEGKQLYINPDVCIDCGACLVECPVEAIYPNEEDAIYFGDVDSVHKNYNFYGFEYKK
jgi:NAD-dependent dihydropyrimidine dehydrogenase PreA subunit